MDPQYVRTSAENTHRDWLRFTSRSRVEAAERNQKFLVLGSVLVLLFTLFDIYSEQLTAVELRLRLINNAAVVTTLLGLIAVLRSGWGQRAVFPLLFVMASCVLAGQAYLLTEVTDAPGRLAFHYLAVLALTMAGIQWLWQWQAALGLLAVSLIALSLPSDHADFGFYLVSLSGCVFLSTVFGRALVLMRFDQFQSAQRLEELNQENLQRRDEMEALNLEMRDFAYAMSHDLRAPLINLDGFSKVLSESVGSMDRLLSTPSDGGEIADQWGEIRDDMNESLGFIRGAAKKMGRLIEGILQLSRLDRRSRELAEVDMNQVVAEALDSLHHQIDQRQISVHVEALPNVYGDRLRLSQLFGNLIDNSIKYMKPDGDARIEIDSHPGDAGLVFRVSDNGIGIRTEDHGKIFRVFARSGANATQGDGIGLSAVKKIVDQHRGKIWVDGARSELGAGTTICFTLPDAPGLEYGSEHSRRFTSPGEPARPWAATPH